MTGGPVYNTNMFAERGSHMVTIFETPAEGADDDYIDWYTGSVSQA